MRSEEWWWRRIKLYSAAHFIFWVITCFDLSIYSIEKISSLFTLFPLELH